jgi:hypothetical protein
MTTNAERSLVWQEAFDSHRTSYENWLQWYVAITRLSALPPTPAESEHDARWVAAFSAVNSGFHRPAAAVRLLLAVRRDWIRSLEDPGENQPEAMRDAKVVMLDTMTGIELWISEELRNRQPGSVERVRDFLARPDASDLLDLTVDELKSEAPSSSQVQFMQWSSIAAAVLWGALEPLPDTERARAWNRLGGLEVTDQFTQADSEEAPSWHPSDRELRTAPGTEAERVRRHLGHMKAVARGWARACPTCQTRQQVLLAALIRNKTAADLDGKDEQSPVYGEGAALLAAASRAVGDIWEIQIAADWKVFLIPRPGCAHSYSVQVALTVPPREAIRACKVTVVFRVGSEQRSLSTIVRFPDFSRSVTEVRLLGEIHDLRAIESVSAHLTMEGGQA